MMRKVKPEATGTDIFLIKLIFPLSIIIATMIANLIVISIFIHLGFLIGITAFIPTPVILGIFAGKYAFLLEKHFKELFGLRRW